MTMSQTKHQQLYIKDRDFYHVINFTTRMKTEDNKSTNPQFSFGVHFHIANRFGEFLGNEDIVPVEDDVLHHHGDKVYSLDKTNLPKYLDPKFSEVLVIDSIKSGKGRILPSSTANSDAPETISNIYDEVIRPILNIINVKHTYYRTETETSIAKFSSLLGSTKQVDGSQKQVTLIILSGDTSIHEFVNNLSSSKGAKSQRELNFGIIPLGTGNAFALELGITNPIEAVLNIFSNSFAETDKLAELELNTVKKIKPFTLYEATFSKGSYYYNSNDSSEKNREYLEKLKFFVVLSWGFHAAIVADSDSPQLRQLGNDRFKVAALDNINHIKQEYKGEVYIRDQTDSSNIQEESNQNQKNLKKDRWHFLSNDPIGHYSYFLISLVNSLEPGFKISPSSDFLKSQAYVILIPYIRGDSINQDGKDTKGANSALQSEIFDGLPPKEQKDTFSTRKSDFSELNKFLLDILTKVYDNSKHIDDTNVGYTKLTGHELALIIKDDKDNDGERRRRICIDGKIVVVDNGLEDANIGSSNSLFDEKKFVKVKSSGNTVGNWTLNLIAG